MLLPMAALASGCLVIGFAPLLVAPVLDSAVAAWAPEWASGRTPLQHLAPLGSVTMAAVAILAALGVLGALLGTSTRRAVGGAVGTWDCGYAAPGMTMQYSSSSFGQMLVGVFSWALWPAEHVPRIHGVFPRRSSFHSHVPDLVLDWAVYPAARSVGRAFAWMRWLQLGSINAYLLYILITLVALLLWRV
jgi:hypothetical protein